VISEKIIFSQADSADKQTPQFDPQMMEKIKEMMDSMDPAELKNIQDKVANLNESERADMMNKAKNMGLF
jgi:hypothetical protein